MAEPQTPESDTLLRTGALLDANHLPKPSADAPTICSLCGQEIRTDKADALRRHSPATGEVAQADHWTETHPDLGFGIGDVGEAYMALRAEGEEGDSLVTARDIAQWLAPNLNTYCDDLEAVGVNAIDWITPTVATLIRFEQRHERLSAVNEGDDVAIVDWKL
jgi:hypothetical protein